MVFISGIVLLITAFLLALIASHAEYVTYTSSKTLDLSTSNSVSIHLWSLTTANTANLSLHICNNCSQPINVTLLDLSSPKAPPLIETSINPYSVKVFNLSRNYNALIRIERLNNKTLESCNVLIHVEALRVELPYAYLSLIAITLVAVGSAALIYSVFYISITRAVSARRSKALQ